MGLRKDVSCREEAHWGPIARTSKTRVGTGRNGFRKLPDLGRNQKANLVIIHLQLRAGFQLYKEEAIVQHRSAVTGITYIRDRVLEMSCSSLTASHIGGRLQPKSPAQF